MKAASIKQIKTELELMHPTDLVAACIRLAKFRLENKELLTYLLFESQDEQSYVRKSKETIKSEFSTLNKSRTYLAKKTIRKALRTTNKLIKYSGKKQTEIELLICFCNQLRRTGLPIKLNTVIGNMYFRQHQKIMKIYNSLHPDLQFDYTVDIEMLR
ncbi:MAG TPA: hypothetical protein VFC87_02635 [Perlabentimonas sp.]|nr:hypothetical protein [Bacteroidales bacterium]MDD4672978.1 hypothetical protein [Bacteroidales bacterium]MDY0348509.1 hypothetical protein [Tenuifilaceae bacterium]HZJ73679.1 hypothetical protein [Perlabentimonas sp.]